MLTQLLKVESKNDITSITKLAQKIWRHHFTSIIGPEQVEYMLEKYQSVKAISCQLEKGWEYYIATLENVHVGYTGLVPDVRNRKMMISKIYVKNDTRGRGVGSHMLAFVEDECIKRGLDKIWLTVNRYNNGPINWYSRNGFEIVDEVKQDIGNGFFMDDFIFEKKIIKGSASVTRQ